MTKEQLLRILDKFPKGTEIYIRQGDDAWAAKATAFEGENVLYLSPTAGDHRNYPEGYTGAKERKL